MAGEVTSLQWVVRKYDFRISHALSLGTAGVWSWRDLSAVGAQDGRKEFWKGQGSVKDTLESCVSPAVSPRRVGGFPWLGGASVAVLTAALCSRGHPGAPPAPAWLS